MKTFKSAVCTIVCIALMLGIVAFYTPQIAHASSTNIALNKTATAFATSGGYSPDDAIDGTTTYAPSAAWAWDSSLDTDTDGSTWWQVDLTERADIDDVKIYFWGYDNIYSHVPESITFQISNDGANWITVVNESLNVPTEGTTYSSIPYSYSLNTEGRYLRLKFEDLGQNGGPIIISEIEVYGELLGTNIAQDKSAIAFATSSGYSADDALDGTTVYAPSDAWAWDSSLGTDTDGSTWWQVDLSGRATIDDVKIFFWGYNDIYSHVPATITFETSIDGTHWTTVINESSNVPTESNSYSYIPYTYSLNTEGRYLRLRFEDLGQNGGPIIISEIEVYGEMLPENVALNKYASAYATYSGYSPNDAVDGVITYAPSDAWAWDSSLGTDTDGSTWWQIDLMGKADIDDVKLFFWGYNDIYSHVRETITFQTSNDGLNWTTNISKSSNVPTEGNSYSYIPYTYTLDTVSRYVRLKFEDLGQNGGSIISSEIEVYGEMQTSNVAIKKPTTAFATSASGYSTEKAVDGLTSYVPTGTWAWDSSLGTDTDGSTWWQVTTGRVAIDDIRIYFCGYNDIYSHVPETITFQTSTDGINWTTAIDKSSNVPTEGASYSDIPYTYDLDTEARYVRLKFEDLGQNGGPIIISEIEVYGEMLTTNVAVNKPATAYATSSSGYSPNKAIDGITSYVPTGAWAWDSTLGTDTDGSTWWQVDLRGRKIVDDIRIYFWGYNDIYSHVPETITFQTSVDGVNWTTVIDKTSNVPSESTTYSDIPYTYPINEWANFVRLKFEDLGQNDGPIIISEVEVYGLDEFSAPIESFSFDGLNPQVDGRFNNSEQIIYLTVPYGTNLTSLVATFDCTANSVVKVGSTVQQSGVTQNDFTNPVNYFVTDGKRA